MENTYDNNQGWKKSLSEKGQPFYEKEKIDYDTLVVNNDWEKNTNKILKNIIKQGGDRIEINDIENKIYQDNLLHLRNIDANLEEAAKIFSIKKYLFNQKLRGRITEKDILHFLRKKRVEE
jgi:hypothetical protein